jgi:hypothetical protein
MKRTMLLLTLCAAFAARSAIADEPPTAPSPLPAPAPSPSPNAVRAACETDVPKVCPGVQPGGGRIIQCLVQHQNEVSEACRQALTKAKQGSA